MYLLDYIRIKCDALQENNQHNLTFLKNEIKTIPNSPFFPKMTQGTKLDSRIQQNTTKCFN